jgi:hypothetical protein
MLPAVGGARGEIALGISDEGITGRPALSNWLLTGATTNSNNDSLAIAEAVALQTGQKSEEAGDPLRSAQKWNCAPRKITASNRAKRGVAIRRGASA